MKIIVTGSASGIGLHTLQRLVELNHEVISVDKTSLDNDNLQCKHYCVDLLDPNDTALIFREIGDFDIAINCAGVSSTRQRFDAFELNDYMEAFNANFHPFFNAIHNEVAVSNANRAKKRKIINIASITGHYGCTNMAAYGAAKAAILNLSKVIAVEHAPNLQVNSISPATIDTPMIRNKYQGELPDYSNSYLTGDCGHVEDVFSVIQMLMENHFMTGQDIKLDGGFSAQFHI
ncbi:SDR family oxidoreductase [Vibrio sp. S4M6]|uniref:SDR family NAD(P)-dependent oxidoreductase n=1 Tax=Vibrio sinus TaxID=2946865 RepID=UPI002029F179|nr:SDR family oxidoreductase [Vibrio sinus]MCL9781589.1 SDR family oxidoreductase [Vibrio sinus]